MRISKIPFKKVHQLSERDVAYATADPILRPFYQHPVHLDSFADAIAAKKNQSIDRNLLADTLLTQYRSILQTELPQKLALQVDSLRNPNTFTLVTAHQPSLATGPLYYLYKIAGVIRLARILNEKYPQYHIVPVFVSGAEDHDLDEVNHLNLLGERIRWQTPQTGPTGMMTCEGLDEVVQQIRKKLMMHPHAHEIAEILKKAYALPTYGQAALRLVYELFSDTELIALDMNDTGLKKAFVSVLGEELWEQKSSSLVTKTQAKLEVSGFKAQAHARDINVFYMLPGLRERIVREENEFRVLNTDLCFSNEAMRQELAQHPERFSPNVVLRPLYQETILPNLAYLGGGGEIAYWLERKAQFEAFNIPFPMLIRRNSLLWLEKDVQKQWQKTGLALDEIWADTDTLVRNFVVNNSEEDLSLANEKQQVTALYNHLAERAKKIDVTLQKTMLAEGARHLNTLEKLEKKMLRAQKKRFESQVRQIERMKDSLFPGNGLQERHDNGLYYLARFGKSWIETLVSCMHPLEQDQFLVIQEE